MDSRSQHSKLDLPNTLRVCDKILKYLEQFGQDRDLEKFMRLYSPAISQEGDIGSSQNYCCESLAMIPSRPLSVSCVINSKSLPNIDLQGQAVSEDCSSSPKDVVDINIQTDGEKGKILSISTENLVTPKKTFKSIKTQTPESVAKTHRRLEWDSLGDIGYKKSMSTSNVNTIERSVLRELFKERSIVSEPSPSVKSEVVHLKTDDHKTVKKLKATETEHSTPPLASSTLLNKSECCAKPKMMSQSTSSTSLNEKFDKCAQTSLINPPAVRSQEIQCTMSSSYSLIEGTATPSSFEYYSSKSSKSKSSNKSSDIISNTNSQKQFKPLEHPFITSITDLLMKRKYLGEKNNIDLHKKFQVSLDENKENQSHSLVDSSTAIPFSLTKQAPELDLGIQLICSLIDTKSINSRHKKQLIRDIIKRLTRLEAEEKTINSSTVNSSADGTTSSSSKCLHTYVCDSVRSNDNRHQQRNMIKSMEMGISPITTEHGNIKGQYSTSSTNGSEHVKDILAKQPKHQEKSKPKDKKNSEESQLKGNINASTQNNMQVSSSAAISKETQSEQIMMKRNTDKKQTANNRKLTSETQELKCIKTSLENKKNRCTQTSNTPLSSTSSSSKKSIPEISNELNNSNTDAEQPTMREWLNPLTHSEIEYEKKQLQVKQKAAAQQEKLNKKSKSDCGRVHHLNWIENEIKRLECLKHLILKDETTIKSSPSMSNSDYSLHKLLNKESTQTDKLYDSVYSGKSSVLSESAEKVVKEIEIILEESHEDVVNLKDNIKCTKDRKKETQIIYKKGENSLNKAKPKFRIIDENTNFHEEQILNDGNSEKQQREKIDTPSTDISKESESLRDLVQQRKRDFMEAYRSKKQHHYDALKKQNKEDFRYLNIPQKLSAKPPTTTDSDHYSVPHTIPRKYAFNDVSYYSQHPSPITPTEKQDKLITHDFRQKHINTATAVQQQSTKTKSTEVFCSTSTSTNNYATTSSSSMFCMSSDVSVPIGLKTTSSSNVPTPISVAEVSVQTSDIVISSKPNYESTHGFPTSIPNKTVISNPTTCIKLKPKGIAYIIEFDENKHTVSKSTSDTDTNPNNLFKKSNAKFHYPTTALEINNSKSSLPTEPVLTLQEHLEKKKPTFLKHSKERKAILNQLQSMRQERVRQLREMIDNTSLNSLERRLQYLPPPPIQKVRILQTKEMKALTNKRFASLPEVVAKQEQKIEERNRRCNRILRDVFNKRLQKRVRSGKLSLNHSKTVI